MTNYKNIAIIGRRNSEHLVAQVTKLAQWLQDFGCRAYLDSSVADDFYCPGYRCGVLSDWVDEIDLAIIVGGDGTMLSAGRQVVNYGIPLVGINQGRLGFMTDIAISEMLTVIKDMLVNHAYIKEERSLLQAKVLRGNQVIYDSLALNDIVISRGDIGSMIEFEMSISGEFVHAQKSDGVIFSTPTGSTAYSLAAGGPILHPHSKVFSIVPICPQSMSNRPIVVCDEVVIELTIIKDNTTILHYDGQEYCNLAYNDKIKKLNVHYICCTQQIIITIIHYAINWIGLNEYLNINILKQIRNTGRRGA